MKRIALALVVAVSLTGCSVLPWGDDATGPSSIEDDGPSRSGPPENPEASAVYDQELTWRSCGDFECASIDVPLDWSEPDGPTFAIALSRRPADDRDGRIGSLLINPGGPGGSGIDLLDSIEDIASGTLLAAYDIVGFDPRGVGESSPVDCGDGKTLDEYYVNDYIVETQDELEQARSRTRQFAENCRELSGRLIENVDTVSAARDLDVMRAVLGDDKLNFLGFSYGTQLGATYAQFYPERVGRVVLDGAVDVLLDSTQQSLQQAAGFENALTSFLEWCVERESCDLNPDVETARRQVAQIAKNALEDPYPADGATPVNGNLMIYGMIVTLYDEINWEYLELALNEVLESETARIFSSLGNFYLDRNEETGEWNGNSGVAFTAISCLDSAGLGDDWTIADQRDFARQVNEVSPTFGWWFAGSGGCEGWPYAADEVLTELGAAADSANPMLVIGTTNDPATPYRWAEALAEDLGAPLLTYSGEGHTAYGRSNQCVTDVVDAYLVDGVVPEDGVRC
ncbi:alpha/beta hydrolase [Demequina sp. TTPB684]|uniref:alpha/beta hydrolase n=1 Tax=unclassified Demequina TaxID=2620311 RepID=UPI001CF47B4A|nr:MULTISPECIES: alpha/beta hydrolase [unclassified Demequina]MCB2413131.1 alpha/beta hydrolase [Demequina sp. TTPB684]UPU87509.1 alpha/beta hydrolase [Demequina sp. TMPB413]